MLKSLLFLCYQNPNQTQPTQIKWNRAQIYLPPSPVCKFYFIFCLDKLFAFIAISISLGSTVQTNDSPGLPFASGQAEDQAIMSS